MHNENAAVLAAAESPWDAAESLLRAWNAGGRPTSPLNREDTHLEAAAVVDVVSQLVEDQGLQSAGVMQTSFDLDQLDEAYAVAYGIDVSSSVSFTSDWLRVRGAIFELAPGDLYPVSDMRLKGTTGYSTRPHRLSLPVSELPHIRQHNRADVDVVVDARFGAMLDSLISQTPIDVAAVLLNEDWSELSDKSSFPIAAIDRDEQLRRIKVAAERAAASGASVLVLPELAVPEEGITLLRTIVAGPEPMVIVFAGSRHVQVDGFATNRATVLIAGGEWEQDKATPFEDRDGAREGIAGGRRLRVTIATGEHVRVACLICKDFLAAGHADLLGDLGVHLVGVPATSEGLGDFGTSAHAVLRRSQGCTIVANNPRSWPSGAGDHALMAHPVKGLPREVTARAAAAPGLSAGTIGTGWQPFEATH